MRKECKGCSVREQFITVNTEVNDECVFIVENIVNECPCFECLVKVMCTETCPERFEAIRKLLPLL